ncbi:uncharacterized protein METZ01_LOCUS339495, partial [marine metagenome]
MLNVYVHDHNLELYSYIGLNYSI